VSGPPPDPRSLWEARYGGTDEYLYGTEPNDFLRASAAGLAPGDVLCLADGEGRNGVHLAGLGHRVTSVDLTEAGMAKAARLAADRGVELTTVVADLADYDLGTARWDLIVSIFAHLPPPVRARIHGSVARALRPGGRLMLEAYTPDQIGRGTGGPPVPELTMTLDGIRRELSGMRIESGRETVRPVVEGPGHTGDGAVVQVIAVPDGRSGGPIRHSNGHPSVT
jgi:SAM-dependent methyltransferase